MPSTMAGQQKEPSGQPLTLWVKGEIFTFGTLSGTPHSRLGFSNIRKIVAYCKNKGAQGYPRVQYSIWKHIACNKLQLTDETAWMYFEMYHLMSGEHTAAERLEMFHLNNQPEKSTVRQKMTADTLQFVLFLYIQQLHKISMKSSLVTGDEWPSRTRSPDLESARAVGGTKNFDENAHHTFVTNHLNNLIELLMDPVASSSSTLSHASEVNVELEVVKALGFLLGGSIDNNKSLIPLEKAATLPQYLQETGYDSKKGTFVFKSLHSWLRSNLTSSPFGVSSCIAHGKRLSWLPIDPSSGIKRGKIGTNGHLVARDIIKGNKVIIMTQVSKQLVARSSGTLEQAYIKIHRCQWSTFYLLSPLRAVSIEKCKNTTVVLGPVETAVIVSGCENVTVIASCGRIAINSSVLCNFYLLTPTRPLLLAGNEAITFAPYNTFYGKLEEHMRKNVIPASINQWNQPMPAGADQHADLGSAVLLPPPEYQRFVIPFEMEGKTTSIPYPIPTAYRQALDAKKKEYRDWQKSVTESGLSDEQRQTLQSLVEQQFQEWLNETGHKKEIDAIVSFIDHKAKTDARKYSG